MPDIMYPNKDKKIPLKKQVIKKRRKGKMPPRPPKKK